METLSNLAKAFIGESMARNKYDMYSKVAKKEGYEQVSAVFAETAEQEREHAKWLYKMLVDLGGKEVIVESSVPVHLGSTAENLKAAIDGETYEYTKMYPEFAQKAEEEGYPEIAARLRAIATAEDHHEKRYTSLLEKVSSGSVHKRDKPAVWICRKCGYQHSGNQPPEKCPACGHPTAYFQVKSEEY
jgi:rubrerythrin